MKIVMETIVGKPITNTKSLGDFGTRTDVSTTEPDVYTHPVKTFLREAGLNTVQFPAIKFVIELKENSAVRAGQVYLPLQLPRSQGLIYESICRATRVIEIPDTLTETHRKFLEIEWLFDETPLLEEHHHAAYSFLAREMVCPTCKGLFVGSPEYLSKRSVRINCPQCQYQWVVNVEMDKSQASQNAELVLDLFREDPVNSRATLAQWDSQPIELTDSFFYRLFQFDFSAWENASSLSILFDDQQGWSAISNGGRTDFQTLMKSFVNHLTRIYFRESSQSTASQLDKTDIQRKSEIKRKVEQIPLEKMPGDFVTSSFDRPITQVTWSSSSAASETSSLKSGSRRSVRLIALSLVLLFSLGMSWMFASANFRTTLDLVIGMLNSQLNSSSHSQSASSSSVSEAVEMPTQDLTTISNLRPAETETTTEAPKKESVAKSAKKKGKEEAKSAIKADEKQKNDAKALILNSPTVTRDETTVDSGSKDKNLQADHSYRQGMLHLRLHHAPQAIEEFKKVLALDSKHSAAHRALGLAYYFNDQYLEAIGSLETYLDLVETKEEKEPVEELLASIRERTKSAANSEANQ